MLDFCAERGVICDIEFISIDKINEAYERMLKRHEISFRHRHGFVVIGNGQRAECEEQSRSLEPFNAQ
jgi:hypothetical protein